MKRMMMWGAMALAGVGVTGCVSSGGGSGWFVVLLVLGLLVVIVVKLFRESEATSDSLISIEGQLRRLNNKLDEMTGGSGAGGGAKKPAAKKTTSKKKTAG